MTIIMTKMDQKVSQLQNGALTKIVPKFGKKVMLGHSGILATAIGSILSLEKTTETGGLEVMNFKGTSVELIYKSSN